MSRWCSNHVRRCAFAHLPPMVVIESGSMEHDNNPLYEEIDVIPLEVFVREDIGVVVNVDDITPSLISSLPYGNVDPNKYVNHWLGRFHGGLVGVASPSKKRSSAMTPGRSSSGSSTTRGRGNRPETRGKN